MKAEEKKALIKFINANYLIRVKYADGYKLLRGAGRVYIDIGEENANKLLLAVKKSKKYIYTKKFRRGVKIDFLSK